jgi:hypothetical protein
MTAFNALAAQMGTVSQTDLAGNVSGAASVCATLAEDVTNAQAAPPIPDPAAQFWYTRALADFSKAAADCHAGAQSQDAAMLNESTAALDAGARAMEKVTAAIRALNAG